jgi:hypothetical protein
LKSLFTLSRQPAEENEIAEYQAEMGTAASTLPIGIFAVSVL